MAIRLRDSASTVQSKLKLNSSEFGNLKIYARETYNELCADPSNKWSDPGLEWQALPAKEKELMLGKMREKCRDLFSSDVPKETINRGIEQRVHEARRAWLNVQKAKQGPATMHKEAGPGKPAPTPPYDPVRDPF